MSRVRKPGLREPLADRVARHHVSAMRLCIEEVDLAELTAVLRDRFDAAAPVGYLRGRTALRDAVAGILDSSELEAEDIVDTLIARGFVHYDGDPTATTSDERPWILQT